MDGRYRPRLQTLLPWVSERAFAALRVRVECAWWLHLSQLHLPHFAPFSAAEKELLARAAEPDEKDFRLLADLEFKGARGIPATKHDVKAVEYLLKLRLKKTTLSDRLEFLHIALTSEDGKSPLARFGKGAKSLARIGAQRGAQRAAGPHARTACRTDDLWQRNPRV